MSFLRPLFSLLSLVILALAAYLLWSWYQADQVRFPDGVVIDEREDWQLWLGLGLLGWSFLGRSAMLWLLAKPDRDPTRAERGSGEHLTSAEGARIYVEALGPADGQPIILTHGWSLDSTIWFYAKRDLAKRFRVIVWDHRGLGKSEVESTSAVQLSNMAADLKTVLAYAGARPAVLVGHSIGGMTIQTLARDNPELFGGNIAGVVLLNTTYTDEIDKTSSSVMAFSLASSTADEQLGCRLELGHAFTAPARLRIFATASPVVSWGLWASSF